ncbi:ABC transporter ATP-binding protein [Propionivibrio soli]|uniref:ABC transporter ATP-binding protein n=1 Tax=Propionivibrio soli TaxID=2976531 RepID=UPI0021E7DD74|nr:sn-glycerol-3-phosphate ABC transporter ATP-binding protein UgpC [Propionivibrio soli]
MSAVSLRNVFKSYDDTQVIHGVNLDIPDGEFVVFVGPSGCGKSTLMRMVAGLEDITGGEILIDGHVVNDLPPRDRDIAMVFQDYALYPNKTVFDNMAFGLRLRGTPLQQIKSCVQAAAETLQIEHLLDRLPKALSGGQRQRVAMGRAIVRQPKVFLFDEPLSNLDALLRNQVRAEIKKQHHRLKGTTIYVTHDQVEAMTLADRIVVLRAGIIVQVGTPDEIYHHPRHRFVAGFTGSPPMNFVDATVVAADGETMLNLVSHHRLPLPPSLLQAAGDQIGRGVEFGIRPENVHLAGIGTPAHWPRLSLAVELIEPMGAENLVHFALCQHALIGRFGNDVRPAPGTLLEVALDSDKMHLFDKETGQALDSPPPIP